MRQSLQVADVDSASDRMCLSALLSSLKPGEESRHAVVEVLLEHANRGPVYGAHPTHDLQSSKTVTVYIVSSTYLGRKLWALGHTGFRQNVVVDRNSQL
jgi:hypothetical protein